MVAAGFSIGSRDIIAEGSLLYSCHRMITLHIIFVGQSGFAFRLTPITYDPSPMTLY